MGLQTGRKVCIVFEGRDGAGKGGTIKAITERVSPRIFRVVALPGRPGARRARCTCKRYLPYLPAAGEVVIFDRSWYNRAGVERVMGFLRRVKNRWGRIINIASVAGVRAVGTGRTAYGTSKGAVIALTRQMAVELCDYGITANAIAPGPVDTPID